MKQVTVKIPPGKRVVVIQLIAADNEGGVERIIDYYDGEGVTKSRNTLATTNQSRIANTCYDLQSHWDNGYVSGSPMN